MIGVIVGVAVGLVSSASVTVQVGVGTAPNS